MPCAHWIKCCVCCCRWHVAVFCVMTPTWPAWLRGMRRVLTRPRLRKNSTTSPQRLSAPAAETMFSVTPVLMWVGIEPCWLRFPCHKNIWFPCHKNVMTSSAECFPFAWVTPCDFLPESHFLLGIPAWSNCLELNVSGLVNLALKHFLKGTRTPWGKVNQRLTPWSVQTPHQY